MYIFPLINISTTSSHVGILRLCSSTRNSNTCSHVQLQCKEFIRLLNCKKNYAHLNNSHCKFWIFSFLLNIYSALKNLNKTFLNSNRNLQINHKHVMFLFIYIFNPLRKLLFSRTFLVSAWSNANRVVLFFFVLAQGWESTTNLKVMATDM